MRRSRRAPASSITQLFLDNEIYFEFVEAARDAGIGVPIIPGIMPITNLSQIKTITGMCGATIPAELERELEGRADDPEAVVELGVAYATLQCSDLLARGAPGIHFYTLNKSPATRAILAALAGRAPAGRGPTGWRQRSQGPEGLSARRGPAGLLALVHPLGLAQQLQVVEVAERLGQAPAHRHPA